MRLDEFLERVERESPELAAQLKEKFVPANGDLASFKVVTRFKLEKFEGEYTPEKQPYEVIEGGDDIPTTVTRSA